VKLAALTALENDQSILCSAIAHVPDRYKSHEWSCEKYISEVCKIQDESDSGIWGNQVVISLISQGLKKDIVVIQSHNKDTSLVFGVTRYFHVPSLLENGSKCYYRLLLFDEVG
jgi:hypothetical protein